MAAPNGIATIVDNYKWSGWLDLSTSPNHGAGAGPLAGQPLLGKWLSFGATADEVTPGQYPTVNTVGVVANGAWVAGRATFIYNEPITIGANVNLATIKIQGSGLADNNAQLAVRPTTLFGRTPADLALHAPTLGEHSAQVLAEAGFSADEIGHLQSKHTITTTETPR